MADRCVNTNGASFGNGLVEVSRTDRKVTLAWFDDYLFNKSILVGSATTSIDLSNGTIINHLNTTPLFHEGSNPLLSTSQSCDFGVDVHYNSKHNGIWHYIHVGY